MDAIIEFIKHIFESGYLKWFIASMIPVTELRLALPGAILEGLNPIISYFVCAVGNCLPVPFLILLVRPIFDWMKNSSVWITGKLEKIEEREKEKGSLPFYLRVSRGVLKVLLKPATLLGKIVHKLEEKAHSKAGKVKKYEMFGLFVFVAIPLPGTGAWTGSLIAAVFGMRVKDSVPMICLGVFTAGILMTLGASGLKLAFDAIVSLF